MKINCNTQDLINALNIVSKTSSSKTTMPILEGVLIEAYENKLKFTTNDLEIGSEHLLNCSVTEEGKVVVDTKMLNEIIRKLEANQVTLESDESIFTIKSSNGVFKLTVMNADEYPKLPIFSIDNSITLKQKVFKEMVKKTLFAVSNDENRPIYTGSLVKVEDNILTVVAIDGFRLALKKYISNESISNFKSIIPGKVLSEILKILSDNEEDVVKIGVNKNQALFEIGNSTIISRIIEGEFLNYNGIIPNDKETRIKVKTKSILDSFERVALFARESTENDKKSPVKMNIELDGITLSCISQTGDAKESIIAVVEGKEIEIGFNPRFVIDALKVIDDQEIYIDFTSNISPVVLRPIAGNEYMYVVLPIKLKQN
ncbi:MAG: DNA polymerase III subunit beta [Clostridia bacterium]|nr:DNA polymerase III subunit beta [Clostridia bacterium]